MVIIFGQVRLEYHSIDVNTSGGRCTFLAPITVGISRYQPVLA